MYAKCIQSVRIGAKSITDISMKEAATRVFVAAD
jgi:hypothetical protein